MLTPNQVSINYFMNQLNIQLKVCIKCELSLPVEKFYEATTTKILSSYCKSCASKISQEGKEKNKNINLARGKEYFKARRHLPKKCSRCGQLKTEGDFCSNIRNKDGLDCSCKVCHINRNSVRKIQRRKEDPWYSVIESTRAVERHYLNSKGIIKSKNTMQLLGVETWEQYIKHLESTLAPGLSWDDNIHNDHSLPFSWITPGDMDELMMITNYRNRRLITENENCVKGDRYGVLHDGRIIYREEYETIKAEGKFHTICPWYKSTKQDNITG